MALPTLTNPDWLENSTREELEALVYQINGYLQIEHNADGTHGDVTADSLDVEGNAAVGGDLSVVGETSLTGDVTIAGDTTISGEVKLASGLAVSGEDNVTAPGPGAGDLSSYGTTTAAPVVLRVSSNGGGGIAGIPTTASAFPAGLTGRFHLLFNDTSTAAALLHDSASATAADLRLYLGAGQKHILRANDVVGVWRDDTDARWRVVGAQAAVQTITHSDALFTGDGVNADWVVDSGDQVAAWYRLDGDLLTLSLTVSASDVANTPTELRYTLPNSWTVATRADTVGWGSDAGAANQLLRVAAVAGNAYVSAYKIPAADWTDTTSDNTTVAFQIRIPITL